MGPEDGLSSHHDPVRPEHAGRVHRGPSVSACIPNKHLLASSLSPPARSKYVFGNTLPPQLPRLRLGLLPPWVPGEAIKPALYSVSRTLRIQTHSVVQCRTRCSLATRPPLSLSCVVRGRTRPGGSSAFLRLLPYPFCLLTTTPAIPSSLTLDVIKVGEPPATRRDSKTISPACHGDKLTTKKLEVPRTNVKLTTGLVHRLAAKSGTWRSITSLQGLEQ